MPNEKMIMMLIHKSKIDTAHDNAKVIELLHTVHGFRINGENVADEPEVALA